MGMSPKKTLDQEVGALLGARKANLKMSITTWQNKEDSGKMQVKYKCSEMNSQLPFPDVQISVSLVGQGHEIQH